VGRPEPQKNDPYIVEQHDRTDGLIMRIGNTAGALGAIYGGIEFGRLVPDHTASSLAESLNVYLPQLLRRRMASIPYAVLQAEDEIAAIGMAVGAGWAGLAIDDFHIRPGISLMSEYADWRIFAECRL